jgi:hypothetical protein
MRSLPTSMLSRSGNECGLSLHHCNGGAAIACMSASGPNRLVAPAQQFGRHRSLSGRVDRQSRILPAPCARFGVWPAGAGVGRCVGHAARVCPAPRAKYFRSMSAGCGALKK